jgi:hypothetical protein
MSFSNEGRFHQQVRFLRRQFLQDGELLFSDVLSEGTVSRRTWEILTTKRIEAVRLGSEPRSDMALHDRIGLWTRTHRLPPLKGSARPTYSHQQ